jgi:hypothetical protein
MNSMRMDLLELQKRIRTALDLIKDQCDCECDADDCQHDYIDCTNPEWRCLACRVRAVLFPEEVQS